MANCEATEYYLFLKSNMGGGRSPRGSIKLGSSEQLSYLLLLGVHACAAARVKRRPCMVVGSVHAMHAAAVDQVLAGFQIKGQAGTVTKLHCVAQSDLSSSGSHRES